MITARDAGSRSSAKARDDLCRAAGVAPTLGRSGSRRPEARFLEPKVENVDLLEYMVVEAIRDQAFSHRNYHPEDPTQITERMKRSPDYVEAVDALWDGNRELLAFLKHSRMALEQFAGLDRLAREDVHGQAGTTAA